MTYVKVRLYVCQSCSMDPAGTVALSNNKITHVQLFNALHPSAYTSF